MVTPEAKDRVLIRLVSTKAPIHIYLPNDAAELGMSADELNAILEQMDADGLISAIWIKGSMVSISKVKCSASDLLHRGGYSGRELIYSAGLEELGLRLEILNAAFGDIQAHLHEDEASVKKKILKVLPKLVDTAAGLSSIVGVLRYVYPHGPVE